MYRLNAKATTRRRPSSQKLRARLFRRNGYVPSVSLTFASALVRGSWVALERNVDCRVIWMWSRVWCIAITWIAVGPRGTGSPALLAEGKSIASGPEPDTSTSVTSRLCLALRAVMSSRLLSAQYIRPMPEEDNGLRGLNEPEPSSHFSFYKEALPDLEQNSCPRTVCL